jgi:hypothetical protein
LIGVIVYQIRGGNGDSKEREIDISFCPG